MIVETGNGLGNNLQAKRKMKTALKLVLIYFVMQILAALTAGPLTVLYVYFVYGSWDAELTGRLTTTPTMFLGFVYMAWYLGKQGYLKDNGLRYAFPSLPCMGWTLLAGVGAIVLVSGLDAALSSLPDWMEQTFDVLQSGWPGIVCVALLGPVLEELLFRGAVMDVLLRSYRPAGAIVLSGLVFGVFHINPAQVVGACFTGFLLGWLYYRTRSLWPGILVHVVNNSLSVVMNWCFPEIEEVTDIPGMTTSMLAAVLAAAAALLAVSVWRLQRQR